MANSIIRLPFPIPPVVSRRGGLAQKNPSRKHESAKTRRRQEEQDWIPFVFFVFSRFRAFVIAFLCKARRGYS
jgi:hypothetical protein